MRRHDLKHLHVVSKVLADGSLKTYYYHRRSKKPIVGEFGSDEFLRSYLEANERERPAGEKTLRDLIRRYRQSSDFKNKAPRTLRDYDEQLAHLDDIWGDMPLDVLDDRSVRSGIKAERDRLAERSERRADYFVQVLSIVLNFAVDGGLLERNSARRIGKVYSQNRSEKIWPDAAVDRFMQVASAELKLAMRLALDTGQRQGDLLRLPWSAFDGVAISLRQSKTGAWVDVPCTEELRAALNSATRRSTIILTNSKGKPWTPDGFRSSWRKNAKAAGIDGVTFNDLRGTSVTRLADAGCTIPQIVSITGHSLKSATAILEKYLASTRIQADAAIELLDDHRRRRTDRERKL